MASFAIDRIKSVRAKIDGWKLDGRLQIEILERLYEELAERPTAHLRRLPPPADIREYQFCLYGIGDPAKDHLFVFTVVDAADEQTLIIKDCSHLSI